MQQETSKSPLRKRKAWSTITKSPRVRQTAGVLVLALVAWGIFTTVRVSRLKAQGNLIGERTQKFKTDYFVGNPKAQSVTYVVLGDSTAAGWGADKLEATYPYKLAQAIAQQGYRVHVLNFAQGGATISDVCQKQMNSLWTVRPEFVTVSVGANDAMRGTLPQEYTDNTRTLLSALQNSDAQMVLYANTPDMYQAPALPLPLAYVCGSRARVQNRTLIQAKPGPKIGVVNLYDKGKLIYNQDPTLYAADLFHPSSRGYAQWADIYIQKLKEAVR